MDGTNLIWELIKDNFEQARSHEEYRGKTVSLTMTVGSIFLAALAIDGFATKPISLFGHDVRFQTIDGCCLIVVGLFGAVCSQKHYERNRMHIALAQEFLTRLNKSQPDLLPFDTVGAFKDFKKTGKYKARWIEPVKLNLLWTGFPLIIACVGLLLVLGA